MQFVLYFKHILIQYISEKIPHGDYLPCVSKVACVLTVTQRAIKWSLSTGKSNLVRDNNGKDTRKSSVAYRNKHKRKKKT